MGNLFKRENRGQRGERLRRLLRDEAGGLDLIEYSLLIALLATGSTLFFVLPGAAPAVRKLVQSAGS
jgi:hypothetical protein